MKRALLFLVCMGLTAVITYLAVNNQVNSQMAAQLEKSLADANTRMALLQSDLDQAQHRLAEFQESQEQTLRQLEAARQFRRAHFPNIPTLPPSTVNSNHGPQLAGGGSEGSRTILINDSAGPSAWAGAWLTARGRSPSSLVVEGKGPLGPWQLVSPFIAGRFDVGAGFPEKPGVPVKPGLLPLQASAFVRAAALYSVDRSGEKYSDAMDELVHAALHADEYPRIEFNLSRMRVLRAPSEKSGGIPCRATGTVAIAGVTNNLAVDIEMILQDDGKVRLNGTTSLNMSDFKVVPPSLPFDNAPSPSAADQINVGFSWLVQPHATTLSSAN